MFVYFDQIKQSYPQGVFSTDFKIAIVHATTHAYDSNDFLFLFTVTPPPPPSRVITDLKQELEECFLTGNAAIGASYRVILSVDQPVPHTNQTHDIKVNGPLDPDVGHAWITIVQELNGVEHNLSIGLYPKVGAKALVGGDIEGVIGDDGGHIADVSATFSMTPFMFSTLYWNLRDYALNPIVYNLSSQNCTTFATHQLNNLGLNIPTTEQNYGLGGGGQNPGDLGEDLRNYSHPKLITLNQTYHLAPPRKCD